MKINNKELIQSYVFTTAKYDFSVYEKRIMYRMVELCQFLLEGKTLQGYSIQNSVFDEMKQVTIPLSAFLKDEQDDNYSEIKKALKSLRNKTLEYEDDKMWKLIGIIELPKFIKKGYVQFEIHPEIYQAILSFGMGHRKIELKAAMSFESTYSMRWYELFSKQEKPMTLYIDDIKERFKIEGKYKQSTDFIKAVLEKPMNELNDKSPYSFTYTPKKKGNKYNRIEFKPKYIAKNADPVLEKKQSQKKTSIRWDFNQRLLRKLYEFDWSKREIENNRVTFKEASICIDDFELWLSKKLSEGKNKDSPNGYVINSMKREIERFKNTGGK